MSAVVPERPRPARKPTDWGQLADSLGVALPAAPPSRCEPTPVESAAEPSLPSAAFLESAEAPASEQEQATGESAEDVEEFEDAAAEIWRSEMVELNDPLFLDTPATEPTPLTRETPEPLPIGDQPSDSPLAIAEEQTLGEQEERRGRRRRRRRRKIRRDDRREERQPAMSEEPEGGEAVPADIDSNEDSMESFREAEEEAGEPDTDRRRRRRGRKRRSSEKRGRPQEGQTAEAETDVESWNAHEEGGSHDEDIDDEDKAQLSHRAIPTWEQAIQLVIAKNLEARAKNPNGGQPRGRGGRRPRDRKN